MFAVTTYSIVNPKIHILQHIRIFTQIVEVNSRFAHTCVCVCEPIYFSFYFDVFFCSVLWGMRAAPCSLHRISVYQCLSLVQFSVFFPFLIHYIACFCLCSLHMPWDYSTLECYRALGIHSMQIIPLCLTCYCLSRTLENINIYITMNSNTCLN